MNTDGRPSLGKRNESRPFDRRIILHDQQHGG
jgi:hypothetical protein